MPGSAKFNTSPDTLVYLSTTRKYPRNWKLGYLKEKLLEIWALHFINWPCSNWSGRLNSCYALPKGMLEDIKEVLSFFGIKWELPDRTCLFNSAGLPNFFPQDEQTCFFSSSFLDLRFGSLFFFLLYFLFSLIGIFSSSSSFLISTLSS